MRWKDELFFYFLLGYQTTPGAPKLSVPCPDVALYQNGFITMWLFTSKQTGQVLRHVLKKDGQLRKKVRINALRQRFTAGDALDQPFVALVRRPSGGPWKAASAGLLPLDDFVALTESLREVEAAQFQRMDPAYTALLQAYAPPLRDELYLVTFAPPAGRAPGTTLAPTSFAVSRLRYSDAYVDDAMDPRLRPSPAPVPVAPASAEDAEAGEAEEGEGEGRAGAFEAAAGAAARLVEYLEGAHPVAVTALVLELLPGPDGQLLIHGARRCEVRELPSARPTAQPFESASYPPDADVDLEPGPGARPAPPVPPLPLGSLHSDHAAAPPAAPPGRSARRLRVGRAVGIFHVPGAPAGCPRPFSARTLGGPRSGPLAVRLCRDALGAAPPGAPPPSAARPVPSDPADPPPAPPTTLLSSHRAAPARASPAPRLGAGRPPAPSDGPPAGVAEAWGAASTPAPSSSRLASAFSATPSPPRSSPAALPARARAAAGLGALRAPAAELGGGGAGEGAPEQGPRPPRPASASAHAGPIAARVFGASRAVEAKKKGLEEEKARLDEAARWREQSAGRLGSARGAVVDLEEEAAAEIAALKGDEAAIRKALASELELAAEERRRLQFRFEELQARASGEVKARELAGAPPARPPARPPRLLRAAGRRRRRRARSGPGGGAAPAGGARRGAPADGGGDGGDAGGHRRGLEEERRRIRELLPRLQPVARAYARARREVLALRPVEEALVADYLKRCEEMQLVHPSGRAVERERELIAQVRRALEEELAILSFLPARLPGAPRSSATRPTSGPVGRGDAVADRLGPGLLGALAPRLGPAAPALGRDLGRGAGPGGPGRLGEAALAAAMERDVGELLESGALGDLRKYLQADPSKERAAALAAAAAALRDRSPAGSLRGRRSQRTQRDRVRPPAAGLPAPPLTGRGCGTQGTVGGKTPSTKKKRKGRRRKGPRSGGESDDGSEATGASAPASPPRPPRRAPPPPTRRPAPLRRTGTQRRRGARRRSSRPGRAGGARGVAGRARAPLGGGGPLPLGPIAAGAASRRPSNAGLRSSSFLIRLAAQAASHAEGGAAARDAARAAGAQSPGPPPSPRPGSPARSRRGSVAGARGADDMYAVMREVLDGGGPQHGPQGRRPSLQLLDE
eukprot:tig00000145_g8796.t1